MLKPLWTLHCNTVATIHNIFKHHGSKFAQANAIHIYFKKYKHLIQIILWTPDVLSGSLMTDSWCFVCNPIAVLGLMQSFNLKKQVTRQHRPHVCTHVRTEALQNLPVFGNSFYKRCRHITFLLKQLWSWQVSGIFYANIKSCFPDVLAVMILRVPLSLRFC